MNHAVRLAGLVVSAPFPLPGPPANGERPDVVVREGPIPSRLENARDTGVYFQAAPGEWLFEAPDGCGFYARDGSEAIARTGNPRPASGYPAGPAAGATLLAGYFLDCAFPALLHQRGLLPLHGCAVRVGESAILFSGRSGAGKSTLGAWFLRRGAIPLADDLCVVHPGRPPLVAGGTADLLLDPEVVDHLGFQGAVDSPGQDPRGRRRLPATVGARRVPSGRSPLPMLRIYFLMPRADLSEPELRRAAPAVALRKLLCQTVRSQYLVGMGGRERGFRTCAAIAAAGIVREVRYPPGLAGLDLLGERIAADSADC